MTLLADQIVNHSSVRQLAGWVSGKLSARPVILLYHGVSFGMVSGTLRNCEQKHIPLDAFVQHLRALQRHRRVVPLQELIEGMRRGDDMNRAVAITFDDGYENNAIVAAPALADFAIPATFFIATGYIGVDRWIWTDQLEMSLDRTPEKRVQGPDGKVYGVGTLEEKLRALKAIKAVLKRLPHRECLAAVATLSGNLGVDPSSIPTDGDYRFMTWDQARELSRAGFEIGAHTVNHPILSQIPDLEAQGEILGSRDRIQSELGTCSPTFCYPNGKSTDYTPAVAQFCSRHFRSALSANRGHASSHEMYEIKRFGTPGGARVHNIEWMLLRER